MEIKRKRISPFIEWLQIHKKINESEIAIEVDWWDDCKAEVLKQLEDECSGVLTVDDLAEFIKKKNAILGRDNDMNVGNNIITHIKELIFHFHWRSMVNDEDGCYAGDNTALHSLGLAIETLANEIYDRILAKNGGFKDIPTTILTDKPEAVPDDCPEETPCEYIDESKRVMSFKEYTKSIFESVVASIDNQTKDKCIESCLKRIKEEVGSYEPEAILMTALDALGGKVKARVVSLYVNGLIKEYIASERVRIAVENDEYDDTTEEVMNQAVDALIAQIADDVLYEICKKNGVPYEEIE